MLFVLVDDNDDEDVDEGVEDTDILSIGVNANDDDEVNAVKATVETIAVFALENNNGLNDFLLQKGVLRELARVCVLTVSDAAV